MSNLNWLSDDVVEPLMSFKIKAIKPFWIQFTNDKKTRFFTNIQWIVWNHCSNLIIRNKVQKIFCGCNVKEKT